jgi:uncharacterized protein YkwD
MGTLAGTEELPMRLSRLAPAFVILAALPFAGCVTVDQMATASTVAAPAAQRASAPRTVSAQEALAHVNAYRRSYGLPAVRLDEAATRAARAQSIAMAQQDYMSHTAGGDFRERLMANGVGRTTAVENLAVRTSTVAETVALWQASSSHAQNMLTPDVTRMGIAAVPGPSGMYWTLVMAGDARRR